MRGTDTVEAFLGSSPATHHSSRVGVKEERR